MEKLYLDQAEYDAVVSEYRRRYDYDGLSEEEQQAFDEKLDKVVGVKASEEKKESSDISQWKDEMRERYGYDDMSDEEKDDFDNKMNDMVGGESDEDSDPDTPVKVLRRTR